MFTIRTFPDPVLRKISSPVKQIDHELNRLIQGLWDFLKAQPGGIGIAAPQVGILKRVAVIDLSKKIPHAKRIVLINPVIEDMADFQALREGCMSIPHYTANAARASRIKLNWFDESFQKRHKIAAGLEAVCIQHEVDHLDGMLFLDRVSCLNSDVFRRKKYLSP